ncbi:hypothetical protein [Trinickia diaoshuihuensis]|uniref:hypothetical protein n=1 Tax=Trinickia diaoshuihuensis TaxID=2292265 RepID=UPI0013C2BCDB|nr:hypothetical protein [Trinickia diaoshuihuensis]
MKNAIAAINVLGAVAALIAAWWWFRASRTNLPKIDMVTLKPAAPVGMLEMANDMVVAARLNRIAASWSGVAAILGAISIALSSF